VFEVQMPIFVMRQWVRHRTGAFNEFSARYSEMPDIYYIPDVERVQYQSTFNKQGSAEPLPYEDAQHFRNVIRCDSDNCYKSYRTMVDSGMTRELARIVLPVNFYTKVRWTVNLHNLFHFLKLREDPHAQWEIREFANAVHTIVKDLFPVATATFENHIQNAVTISADMAVGLAGALARMASLDEDIALTSEECEFIRRYDK
jgi:thymidylate synthase (FAD)